MHTEPVTQIPERAIPATADQTKVVAPKLKNEKRQFPGLADVNNPDIQRWLESLQGRDWKKELDGFLPQRPEALVAILSVADLDKAEAIQYVKKTFVSEAQNYKIEAEEAYEGLKRTDMPSDYQLESYERVKLKAEAYAAELLRMDTDPEYAYQWFEREREKLIALKNGIYTEARMTNNVLKEMFGSHRKSWIDVEDRVLVTSQFEFKDFYRTVFGRHRPDDADTAYAVVTEPRLNQPRAIVIKLMVADRAYRDAEGQLRIGFSAAVDFAKGSLRHEATHVVADCAHDATLEEGKRYRDDRGFKPFYFNTDGNPDNLTKNNTWREFPYEAIDEGAVEAVRYMLSFGMDIDFVKSRLVMDFTISNQNKKFALATLDRIQKVGFESFARAYINSNVEMWIEEIQSKMGSAAISGYFPD